MSHKWVNVFFNLTNSKESGKAEILTFAGSAFIFSDVRRFTL